MSTANHLETDGPTERVNRVLEDVLRSYATSFASWSSLLSLAEFTLNNAVHGSTGLTPLIVNNTRPPCGPALLAVGHPTAPFVFTLGGEETGGKATASTLVSTSPVTTLVLRQPVPTTLLESSLRARDGARSDACTSPDAPDDAGRCVVAPRVLDRSNPDQ
ncbi:hypothetical protein PC116_g23392 [Phytophthora cactorum]|uniref:Integrase catalytic domain-containing protein n=1 Tax=Phytophthora cactorum TaxID=29920 RepID=A0A329SEP2_9STRA|nr:hypothetical protein PC117_g22489 [Phytophthora cactorum]KAG3136425.1 hypothetical protein C6341_g21392 [Phytophthora cactorum]KAG4228240.1 hypothetical protein PC116_g23392 [Phytophthora cactorum]RAW35130.1 hypothetical protein PC110_g8530 [Phytophthora cactorum]